MRLVYEGGEDANLFMSELPWKALHKRSVGFFLLRFVSPFSKLSCYQEEIFWRSEAERQSPYVEIFGKNSCLY